MGELGETWVFPKRGFGPLSMASLGRQVITRRWATRENLLLRTPGSGPLVGARLKMGTFRASGFPS